MNVTLGIDVGGTTIEAAVVGDDAVVRAERREPTPRGDRDGARTAVVIGGLVREFGADHGISAVGVAVPGVVDDEGGVVISAVNLGWERLPLRDRIAADIRVPLVFGQDVRTGAYAEASRGAAAGYRGVSVFVPIGTGIAAGIIVDGRPLVSGGWAGEIGQLTVSTAAARGGAGTLEDIASASSIARRIGCADGEEAVALVRGGDPAAAAVWRDAIEALAEALAWTTAVLGAEVIVIGGGLAGAGPVLFEPLRAALGPRLGVLRPPAIVGASFGDRAAMIGAGLLAARRVGSVG